jgi:hypothetical protein
LAPRRQDYAAIFLLTSVVTSLEVCLLRLFSVTIWYHFAFLAVSLAMLGLGAGGLCLRLFPAWFRDERALLPATALAFALTIPAGLYALGAVLAWRLARFAADRS